MFSAVEPDELFELILPLHEVCDTGDYWGLTIENYLLKDITMKALTGENALFV